MLFQNKINQAKKKLSDRGLYDVRLAVLAFVGFIAVSVFWSGAKIVQQNYELSQKVEAIKQENAVLELENQNKELQNQYLATDEFADITARRVFGKALPGEKVYIVPKEVALNALTTPEATDQPAPLEVEKPKYQKNLESWMNIYFGN
jgi:cell division protein FtsB